jgi:hypothetical protein
VKPIKTDREDDRLLYRADRHLRNETIGDVDGSEQDVKAPSPPTQEASSAPSADKGSFDSFQQ